jgi:hypothetical protein
MRVHLIIVVYILQYDIASADKITVRDHDANSRSHEDDVAAQEIGERLRRIKDFPRTNHWLIGDDIGKISKSGVDGIYPELTYTTSGC